MAEELIPIVLFAMIAVIVWLVTYFRFRTRSEMQQTVRQALEKGTELTPELLDKLGTPERPADKDLRLGLIWLSVGIALALCGLFVPDPSGYALKGCLSGAVFPGMIGLAYLVMWQFTSRKEAR
jgi:Na+/H+ antiporter NhaD/arsenite permease-like protein